MCIRDRLILDEPTAVLTEKEAEALLDSIRGMAAKGIAVIFITQDVYKRQVLTIFNAGEHEYIALLPMEGADSEEGEVYLYRYSETEDGTPNPVSYTHL